MRAILSFLLVFALLLGIDLWRFSRNPRPQSKAKRERIVYFIFMGLTLIYGIFVCSNEYRTGFMRLFLEALQIQS